MAVLTVVGKGRGGCFLGELETSLGNGGRTLSVCRKLNWSSFLAMLCEACGDVNMWIGVTQL